MLNRLSTLSFAKAVTGKETVDDPASPKYCTQWRWHYEDPSKKGMWMTFEQVRKQAIPLDADTKKYAGTSLGLLRRVRLAF